MRKAKKQSSYIKGVAIDILRDAVPCSAEFDFAMSILRHCNCYAFATRISEEDQSCNS